MSENIIFLSKHSFWDTSQNRLMCDNKPVDIGDNEIRLMQYLITEADSQGGICYYGELIQYIWPEEFDSMKTREKAAALKNRLSKTASNINIPLGKVDPDLQDKDRHIIRNVKGKGYCLFLPPQEDNDGTIVGAYIKPGESLLYAAEQYRRLWADVNLFFIKNRHARSIKKYFYILRDQLPPEKDTAFSLAVAEYLRDVISYSEILLDFAPDERTKNEHLQEKGQILGSELAKCGIDEFAFESELEITDESVFHTEELFDIKSVVAVCKIILEMDRLFLDEAIVPLRKYFYEDDFRKRLPETPEDCELAYSVCEFIKDQLLAGERLLRYIPKVHRISFQRYKDFILKSEVMNEYRCDRAFPWPWD